MKSKIHNIRFLAFVLIIALMLVSTPSPIFAVGASSMENTNDVESSSENEFDVIPKEDLEETTVKSEIISRREENVKHFDIGHGMSQAVTYGTAVHRKDADGVWQDIDNRLLLDSEKNIYSTPDGRTKAARSIGSTNPLISLSENGYVISMTPITASLAASPVTQIENHEAKTSDNISGVSIKEAAKISNSSSIKYSDIFTATDIEYVLESNDIKENIIVKSPQSSYTYSFSLSADNLVPTLEQNGDIIFRDRKTSEEKYYIPAPFMYDADGNVSYNVYYRLSEVKGAYIVTVVADSEWINANGRSFPVTIDPTIKKTILFDTYIDSSDPTTQHGLSTELWISSGRISFLYCSMPSLPSGCSFYAANLYVYYYYYDSVTSGGLTAGAYQVMHSWSETGLTWDIAQPSTTTYISSTRLSTAYMSGSRSAYSSSPQTVSFNVTNAAASWYANSSTNYGIALKYESGTNASVILKSYEAGSDYRAYYVITYTEPQIVSGVYRIKNAQNGLYLNTANGGYAAGTKIQQYSESDGDADLSQLFKITFVQTVGATDQLNYYTIRPMTNNGMGLESSLSGTSRDVTIETMSTSDNWANLLYNHSWVISQSGSYYTIKNGRVSDTSYLTAPSNTTDGATVFTSDTITNYSKWIFEPYSDDSFDEVIWNDYPIRMIPGQTFWCDGDMYSSSIGVNGPVTYRVANTDYTDTDKATIDKFSGRLKANSVGTIKIGFTYQGSPWIWWRTVEVEPSIEGTYHFENKETSRFMQPDNQDEHFMEQHSDNGGAKQSWLVRHHSNGYYTIRNLESRLYLTAPDNSNSGDNIEEHALNDSTIDRQLWRFTKLNGGAYKVQAKAREGTSLCLVVGAGIGNGVNIRQKEFTSDSNYKDEWNLISANDKAIVIVPGITCTHLQTYDGDHIWFDLTQAVTSKLDKIACDENGESIRDDIVPYNPDNYGVLDYYENLYKALKDKYQEEYDIIFFPYDWRFSCATSARQLEIVLSDYDDCVLIAHSMGGLVASSYLDRSSANRAKIDKFISVGTPYTGAPKALYVMHTGKLATGTEPLFKLSKYALNIPAVYELLPSSTYFNSYSSFINNSGEDITSFSDSLTFMKGLSWGKKSDGAVKPMFDEAVSFHATLINNGTHITNHPDVESYKLIGIGEPTIMKINYDTNGYVDYLELDDGDGTVPLYSATNNSSTTDDNVFTFSESHTGIIGSTACINRIKQIIDGTSSKSSASISENNTLTNNKKVTIVTKGIEDLHIINGLGYDLFVEESKVYYLDKTETKICAGYAWVLNDNSYQLLLDADDYTITNISHVDDTSSIRIDYSSNGLSNSAVNFTSFERIDYINVPLQTNNLSTNAISVRVYGGEK